MYFAVFYFFFIIVDTSATNRAKRSFTAEYIVLEVSERSCLYVSNDPIWPYDTEDGEAKAVSNCQRMGLPLASDIDQEEKDALQQLTRCQMQVPEGRGILVKQESNSCKFQKYDGSEEDSSDQNCIEDSMEASEDHAPVHYACYKDSKCEEIKDCKVIPSNPSSCYLKVHDDEKFDKDLCNDYGGYLPRLTQSGQAQELIDLYKDEDDPNDIWVGLSTKVDEPTLECQGFMDCLNDDGWFWLGGGSTPPMDIAISHGAAVNDLHINDPTNCVLLKTNDLKLKDENCDSKKAFSVCTIFFGGVGIGASIAVPTARSDTFLCPEPVEPPAEAKMKLQDEQPILMCPGEKAKYECDAGGINVRQDKPTIDTFEIACNTAQQYNEPDTWPVCVDKLDCGAPILNENIFEFDWDDSKGVTPPFEVKYNCKWPKKMIVLESDLQKGKEDSVTADLTISCQMNGTYDINIEDYVCSRVCPMPTNPDEEIFSHDWDVESEIKPELYDTVKHKCVEEGKQLVPKFAFNTGAPTDNFMDEIMSMCTISGWMNETIGSLTCTRDCGPAINYTEYFTYDWDESQDLAVIGTKVNYQCHDTAKKVVNVELDNSPLYDILEVECLYNGQWSPVITDWSCTECLRRYDPPNGKIKCESKTYEEGSYCYLSCNPGYIALDQVKTRCIRDQETNDFQWDLEDGRLQCIEPVGLVIGGIKETYDYTNNVEILAPGFQCLRTDYPVYPHKIIGLAGGYTRGLNIVCGGAKMEYVECKKHSEGSQDCDRNTECVITSGGARWCTGPKLRECYVYDPFIGNDWKQDISLKSKRAYAASTILPNGQLWISGGVSSTKVLNTIEILSVKNGKWTVKKGPKMPRALTGHCMYSLQNQVVIAGGYSPDTDDYTDQVDIYDMLEQTWYTKPWSTLQNGPRIDSVCTSARFGDTVFNVMAGGWNNAALKVSEYFDTDALKWKDLGNNQTGNFIPSLSQGMRSSFGVVLNDVPYIVGGVKCIGNTNARQVCNRTNEIYALTTIDDNEDPIQATWTLDHDLKLRMARSSHFILQVPKNYGLCKSIE